MSTLVIVAVFDRAAQVYANPWHVTSIGLATRAFSDEVNRIGTDNTVNQHPGDFELYELGTFDNATGRMKLHDDPRFVARGEDLVRR